MDKQLYIWFFIIIFIVSSCLLIYQNYETFQINETLPEVDTSKSYYKTTEADKVDMNQYNLLKDTVYKDLSGTNMPFEGAFDSSNNFVPGDSTQPPIYSQCSDANSCSTCLTTPDCNWCTTKNICVPSNELAAKCVDDKVYNSILQCNLNKDLQTNYSNTESIIPIIGLSRNVDNSLTRASLNIILDSLKARGYSFSDVESKKTVFTMIEKEIDEYNTLYKNSLSSNISNVIDYTLDEQSLKKEKDIKAHIEDLKDVSRYLKLQEVENYVEGFQHNFDFVMTEYDTEILKNNRIKTILQVIWLANLVALGTIIIM